MWTEHFHKRFVFFTCGWASLRIKHFHMWASDVYTRLALFFPADTRWNLDDTNREVTFTKWEGANLSLLAAEDLVCVPAQKGATEGRMWRGMLTRAAVRTEWRKWAEINQKSARLLPTIWSSVLIAADATLSAFTPFTQPIPEQMTKLFFFLIPLSSPRTADRFCPHRWHRLHRTQMAHGPMS